MNQNMKSPLVTHMSDDIAEILGSNTARQKAGMTAYAVGNIFKGIELGANADLNTITQACLRRVDNTVKNGPPILDTTGYLHVITKYHEINAEGSTPHRIRQIIYPDSTNDPTPYTRVGYGAAGGTITWSIWNTLGGNMIRKILDHNIVSTNTAANDKYALPNTMYESFGDYTLELPDPNNYGLGTRIGLEQWIGAGQVKFIDGGDTFAQNTGADIDIDGNYIGAIIYLFEVVDAEGSTLANPIYEWKMDTLQNYDGVIAALQLQLAEHELCDQDNLYNYIKTYGQYVVPQTGYVTSTVTNGVKINGAAITARIVKVNKSDIVTLGSSASTDTTIVFSPDEHAMYLRENILNSSWHDKSPDASNTYLLASGRFSTSYNYIDIAAETPASTKAVIDLQMYVDNRDGWLYNLLNEHKNDTGDFVHRQYMQWSRIVNTYNVAYDAAVSTLQASGKYNGHVASAYSVWTLYNGYVVPNFNSVNARLTDHTGSSTSTTYTANTHIAAHRQYIPWEHVVNTYSTSYPAVINTLPSAGTNANGKIASAKAVYDLYTYANGHITATGTNASDVHSQYVLKRALITTFHSSTSTTSATAAKALYDLASAVQAKGLLYDAVVNSSAGVNLNSYVTNGIYEITGTVSNGPATNDSKGSVSNATLVVIRKSTATAASTAAAGDSNYLVQILVGKDGPNNMWFRTRVGGTWVAWTKFAKTKRTFSTSSSVAADTILGYLKYSVPTIKCTNASGTITITLPSASSSLDGAKVYVEVHGAGSVKIVSGSDSYTATLTNGNPTYIPLECDGGGWYMVCVG